MSDMTINFGIDLGTTNCCIAIMDKGKPEIIENSRDDKYTPSAVAIKKGQIYVGQKAVNRIVRGDENAFMEFKLQMGTNKEYYFPTAARFMKPEELSAELLKSLRADVKNRLGKDITNAVIGVPAGFEIIQTQATLKAAELAGISHTLLIQEPVAAAIAYGLNNEKDRTIWLIYDFGGGTFDAAIVQIIDGEFRIVNHGDDNHLGGKSIDWEIVDKLLMPALKEKYKLSDFNRENTKWKVAFAKLKQKAEKAKIELSRYSSSEIYISNLGQDDEGQWISFEHEIKREDLEHLIEPLIEKSVNICRKVIYDSRITIDDIDKLIMVGGSTLSPILRNKVYEKLNIPMEFSIDPLTVVARGAAIFAGAQPAVNPPEAKEYNINLDFKPTNSEYDPLIHGKVRAKNVDSFKDFQIGFVETNSQWRSPIVHLSIEGDFMTMVHAEKGRTNEFKVILADDKGNTLTTVPDSFPYTIGDIHGQTLIHSIGAANANNTMDILIYKGTKLPTIFHKVFKMSTAFIKSDSGDLLNIPIVEGENTLRADKNSLIGNLIVPGDKIKTNLPAGSEIDITLKIDEFGDINIKAYIPLLNEEIKDVFDKKFGDDLEKVEDETQEISKPENIPEIVDKPKKAKIKNEIATHKEPDEEIPKIKAAKESLDSDNYKSEIKENSQDKPLVFICHSFNEDSKDTEVAYTVCRELEANGIKCWMALRDIMPSEDWDDKIVEAIEECIIMVVIFSEHVNKSTYIKEEIHNAAEEKLEIITFRIEDTFPKKGLKLRLRRKQWLDAIKEPMDPHIQKLIKAVKVIEKKNKK